MWFESVQVLPESRPSVQSPPCVEKEVQTPARGVELCVPPLPPGLVGTLSGRRNQAPCRVPSSPPQPCEEATIVSCQQGNRGPGSQAQSPLSKRWAVLPHQPSLASLPEGQSPENRWLGVQQTKDRLSGGRPEPGSHTSWSEATLLGRLAVVGVMLAGCGPAASPSCSAGD